MKLISARATIPAENSDSILVSFDSRWANVLRSDSEIRFIRKRIPVNICPKYIYIYFKSPVCAIVAKAQVASIGFVSIHEALDKGDLLKMEREEILSYCSGQERIGMCSLVNIHLFDSPVLLSSICKKLDFTPPQSFVIFSKAAVSIIDGLASCK